MKKNSIVNSVRVDDWTVAWEFIARDVSEWDAEY